MPKLGAALDFNQLEARNAAIHNLSAAPSAPVKGQMYYDTVSNTLLWWDGTVWQSARGGVYADATNAAKGIVQLTNDLGGTAALPTVVNLHLAADTAVNHKLTTITDPTNPQDAATKNYVDNQGTNNLNWKQVCRATTSANITLTGLQTVDGVALSAGDRVLVRAQTSLPTNGIYVASAGAWARSADMTVWAQTVAAIVPVGPEGAVFAGTLWFGPNVPGGTINTTNLQLNTALPSLTGYGIFGGRGGVALPGNANLNSIANANTTSAAWGNNNWGILGVADPINPQDAATKNYVDNSVTGLDAKPSVKAASAGANLVLSAAQTVDGIALVAGDRILVKDQTTTSQNGIYIVQTGAWTRALDADTWLELPAAFTFVEQGTVNADTGWICTVAQGGTLGTTAITWTQFSSAGVISAGNGLTKTGNVLSALVDGTTIGFSGSTLVVPTGGIGPTQLASGAVVLGSADVTGTLPVVNGGTGQTTAKTARETGLGAGGYYNNNATHGAGTTITITQATHGLRAGRAIFVQVQDNTTGNVELPDVTVAANGDVTVTYAVSQAANAKLVTLVG